MLRRTSGGTGAEGVTVMYAVNLVALMNLSMQGPTGLPLLVLLRGIVTETVIEARRDAMGTEALLVRDDIGHERWEAIVKLIRTKLPHYEFPLYEKTERGWRNIK
jgi:hypothetical protein